MRTRDLILMFIKKYFEKHCYAHSYEEIQDAIGISKSTTHFYMKKFFQEGELEHDFDDNFSKPRAFRPKGYKCVKEDHEEEDI